MGGAMKVRHKQHHDVVVELDANTRIHWLAGLSKHEWELVPPDRWRDVSGECDVRCYCNHWDIPVMEVTHGDYHLIPPVNAQIYRLRQMNFGTTRTPVWAFLVERKES